MMPSRGMGAVNPEKIKKPRIIHKKDGNFPVEVFKEGGQVGLYANIHAKQKRIAMGSGEKMRKPNSKGAPTEQAFKQSARTAK